MFLALVDSPEVLKIYKYVFDIQRLVGPNFETLIEGGVENADREVSAHKPLLLTVMCPLGPSGEVG